MLGSKPAMMIAWVALAVFALAAITYLLEAPRKNAQRATVQSGVVLLPGETLVAPPDPVASAGAPAPTPAAQAASAEQSAPAAPARRSPTTPKYKPRRKE